MLASSHLKKENSNEKISDCPALAALPVAAMADVTLYGQIKAGVEISKVKEGKTSSKNCY